MPKKLPLTIFALMMLATSLNSVSAQTVPQLSGTIETVWSSDRTSWLEGPAFDGDESIWFADPGNILTNFAEPSRVLRYDIATGDTTVELDTVTDPNVFGIAFDIEGELLMTHLDRGIVTQREANDLATFEIIASEFDGSIILPNDLVFDSAGGFYFTDWKQNTPELGDSAVFYVSPERALSKATEVPQASSSNGIGLSPDQKTAYVARPNGGGIFAYDVSSPGVFENERLFAVVLGGVDGLTVDRHGNVYASDLAFDPMSVPPLTPDLPDSRVRVFNPNGEEVLKLDPPGGAVNMVFDNDDTLYISGWNNLSAAQISYVPEPPGFLILFVGVMAISVLRRGKPETKPNHQQ